MAVTYQAQVPIATTPGGATGAVNIESFSPAQHCNEGDIVVFSAGTQAEGFFELGGSFVTGDTITYAVNGVGSTLSVTSLSEALSALAAAINANTATNLVTAHLDNNLVVVIANTAGTAGNSITLSISTTSTTGEAVASGATLVGGSTLVTPGIVPAATNVASGIVGIAQHDSSANYGGQSASAPFNIGLALGISQVGGLLPLSPSQTLVAALDGPAQVEINLNSTTGWITGGAQQANIGTQVGLSTQLVNGVKIYVADPTQTNKVGTIVGKINGPFATPGEDVGNLGARVLVTFFQSVLAV